MGSKSLRNTVFGLPASNYPYLDTLPDSLLPKMAERPKRLLAHFYPRHLENFRKIDPSRTWLIIAGKVVYAISINFRLLTFFFLSPFRALFWCPKFKNGLKTAFLSSKRQFLGHFWPKLIITFLGIN